MSDKERRTLSFADEGHAFTLRDGRKLYSLKDLVDALRTMDEATFRYHVTKERNDFRNWIKGVLYDKKLARLLRWTTTHRTTLKKIESWLESHYF